MLRAYPDLFDEITVRSWNGHELNIETIFI